MWNAVPYPSYRLLLRTIIRLVAGLFLLHVGAAGCGDDPRAGTREQRGLGDVWLRDDLQFSLQPGTIDDSTSRQVSARASVPLPQFSLAAGPLGADRISVRLANTHRDAQVFVLMSAPLSAASMAGCPATNSSEPIICAEQPQHVICRPLQTVRETMRRATLSVEVDVPACSRLSFGLRRTQPEGDNDLKFAVLGRAESLLDLERALREAAAWGPDFVVLLGDAAENASLNGLREVDFLLRQVDLPAVVLPGESELVKSSHTQFLATFGPFDIGWEVAGSQFYAFYSADGRLGDNGLVRLNTALKRLDATRPAFLFTHTPPFDPLGARDQGFVSAIEAGRTMSVINEAGIDAFFAGHIRAQAHETLNNTPFYLTHIAPDAPFLWVRVAGGEIAVGPPTRGATPGDD